MLWKKYDSASLRNMNPCPEWYDTRRVFFYDKLAKIE